MCKELPVFGWNSSAVRKVPVSCPRIYEVNIVCIYSVSFDTSSFSVYTYIVFMSPPPNVNASPQIFAWAPFTNTLTIGIIMDMSKGSWLLLWLKMKRFVYNQIFIIRHCPVIVRVLTTPQTSLSNDMKLPYPRQNIKKAKMAPMVAISVMIRVYHWMKTIALANYLRHFM